MLRRTAAAALLTLLGAVPVFSAVTAYDRAASMAVGETTLSKGYDGANAAGAVRAQVDGTSAANGLAASMTTPAGRTPSAPKVGFVPSPAQFGRGAAIVWAAGGFALGGPIGALIGAALGFGIGFFLSKLLG